MTAIDAVLREDLTAMHETPLTQPVLSARTVGQVIALLEERDWSTSDQVLHVLLSRATQDPQARELLLHAMRPAIAAITRRHCRQWRIPEDQLDNAYCTVVDVFYDVIDLPGIRAKTTRVAARIRGEILTRLTRQAREDRQIGRCTTWDSEAALTASQLAIGDTGATGVTAHQSQMDLLEGLAWARENEVITLEEARFLIAVYSPDSGLDLHRDLNLGSLSAAAVRKRCSRLAQRIAGAVAEHHPEPLELAGRAA